MIWGLAGYVALGCAVLALIELSLPLGEEMSWVERLLVAGLWPLIVVATLADWVMREAQ